MERKQRWALVGGSVLTADSDQPTPGTVIWEGSRIVDVAGPERATTLAGEPGGQPAVIDVKGRWVLPGIVDLHGDAFERSLMPRPGVALDIDLALADNDHQLLAAGITTSFLSATDSWEPGLRSRETLRTLVGGLARRAGGPDVRLHVRHERCKTDDHDELIDLVASGTVALLSYNDHTTDRADSISMTQVQRTGLSPQELSDLQLRMAANRERGRAQERELAEVAGRVRCPTASHDPAEVDDLQRDLDLGVSIAEFPTSVELAHRYRAADIPVLLGAPNLVRGRSHLGNLSVAEALAAGSGDMLCSDYHYPSLPQAPFVAAAQGIMTFGSAWGLVSAGPADAVGLRDRGRITPGQRADLVVIHPPTDGAAEPARIERVVVSGRPAQLRP